MQRVFFPRALPTGSFEAFEDTIYRSAEGDSTMVAAYAHPDFLEAGSTQLDLCNAPAFVPAGFQGSQQIPLMPSELFASSFQSPTTHNTSLPVDKVVPLVKATLRVFEMPFRFQAAKLKVRAARGGEGGGAPCGENAEVHTFRGGEVFISRVRAWVPRVPCSSRLRRTTTLALQR